MTPRGATILRVGITTTPPRMVGITATTPQVAITAMRIPPTVTQDGPTTLLTPTTPLIGTTALMVIALPGVAILSTLPMGISVSLKTLTLSLSTMTLTESTHQKFRDELKFTTDTSGAPFVMTPSDLKKLKFSVAHWVFQKQELNYLKDFGKPFTIDQF